jgi:dihydrofolate synthase/folylpolyglutamate synthase
VNAAPGPSASVADWLAWQERLHPKNIALGLTRVREVALRLGLPGTAALTLTIAGTNGKGSSAHLSAEICRRAGHRTGLYTSPHLLRYHERIVLDGRPVSDDALCAAFRAVEQARGDIALTYFEFGTLAALWLFREWQVAVQVLEVGLGGRLDAVNLVDADAALVTNIGLDHLDWLGPDREAIGFEKAHVYRGGRPAIFADAAPPASVVAHARTIAADLRLAQRDYHVDVQGDRWWWRRAGRSLDDLPLPGLHGAAQLRNAAGVLALLDAVGDRLPIADSTIRAALPALRLPGRFQRDGRWILDVAHNAEAAAVLADNLRAQVGSEPVHLVLGMLSDKPVATFCEALTPQITSVRYASLPPPRGLSAGELAARAGIRHLPSKAFDSVTAALRDAQAEPEGLILVTGSFLTVAEAMHQPGIAHG